MVSGLVIVDLEERSVSVISGFALYCLQRKVEVEQLEEPDGKQGPQEGLRLLVG